jgi:hypothetical protein
MEDARVRMREHQSRVWADQSRVDGRGRLRRQRPIREDALSWAEAVDVPWV